MLIQSGSDETIGDEYLLEPIPFGPEDEMPWVDDYRMADHGLLHKESSTVEGILSLFSSREVPDRSNQAGGEAYGSSKAERVASDDLDTKLTKPVYVKRQNKPRESRPTIHSS
jgi:hypothetical protein